MRGAGLAAPPMGLALQRAHRRLDEAKAMADVALTLQPGFTISGLVSGNLATRDRATVHGRGDALHGGAPEEQALQPGVGLER